MVTFKTMAQIMHTTVRYKFVHFKCYKLHVCFELRSFGVRRRDFFFLLTWSLMVVLHVNFWLRKNRTNNTPSPGVPFASKLTAPVPHEAAGTVLWEAWPEKGETCVSWCLWSQSWSLLPEGRGAAGMYEAGAVAKHRDGPFWGALPPWWRAPGELNIRFLDTYSPAIILWGRRQTLLHSPRGCPCCAAPSPSAQQVLCEDAGSAPCSQAPGEHQGPRRKKMFGEKFNVPYLLPSSPIQLLRPCDLLHSYG